MTEADYYAPGSYNDPSAPWNEVVIPEKEFDVTCSQTLSKTVSIITNNYNPEPDDETGRTYTNTESTDWGNEYHSNDLHTPLQLIQLLKQVLETDMEHGIAFKSPRFSQDLINECDGWIEDETEYIEE